MSLINVSNLTFAYDGSFDNIFENVSFQIDTDWKLGFTGRNGRGKTTFPHLLLGQYEYSGKISATVPFEYFPFQVANKEQPTLDVIAGISPDFQHWELMRELSLLKVSEDVLYRPFASLSNGEQTKVMLAALFLKENSFLLIDEPTNHLDMEARQLVSGYLHAKSGFILVSHDRAFLDNCVDHILSINKTNIEIKSILRKLDFSRDQFEKDISAYSGGQKKKLLIAKSLCENVHLHIWDEPLNFIDVISRMQIEELLLEHSPTILFVEHDREFCDRIATKMIHL